MGEFLLLIQDVLEMHVFLMLSICNLFLLLYSEILISVTLPNRKI